MTATSLARYNLRVMMFNNWWLLVFPIAASQFAVYWNLITQRFAPYMPAAMVEMVSPLLAAFLCAHTLAAEYRSGIGVILASKPVHIGKIVAMRLTASLALVWALAALSLAGYYYGMEPYDVLRPALACIPSTLFLAMLALTFATLFRNSLAGFGIAAIYWAMDLPPGPAMHPYLSLRSLANSFGPSSWPSGEPYAADWWVAKLVLLAAAIALFVIHGRLVFTLGSPMTARRVRRTLGWAVGLMAVYLVSGATAKVAHAYTHRGLLFPEDSVWLRREFAVYGPLPVSRLFGSVFVQYLGETPNGWRIQLEDEADTFGDTPEHRRGLRDIVEHARGSVWAPSASWLLDRLDARHVTTPAEKAKVLRRTADLFPDSPYAASSLRESARILADMDQLDEAGVMYRELVAKHPESRWVPEALGYLAIQQQQQGNLPAAADFAARWAKCAALEERFTPWVILAEVRKAQGDAPGAAAAATDALRAVRAYQDVAFQPPRLADARRIRWDAEAAAAERRAKAVLGQP